MGCDIHATLEVRTDDTWECVQEDVHLWRNYDTFSIFFGVRGTLDVDPIAAHRGIPDDATEMTKRLYNEMGEDAHSASVLYARDLLLLAELPPFYDNRIHVYEWRNDAWKYAYKAAAIRGFPGLPEEIYGAPLGTVITQGDTQYRIETTNLEESLDSSWRSLLSLLRFLGKHFGDEDVRLVVWFDN